MTYNRKLYKRNYKVKFNSKIGLPLNWDWEGTLDPNQYFTIKSTHKYSCNDCGFVIQLVEFETQGQELSTFHPDWFSEPIPNTKAGRLLFEK